MSNGALRVTRHLPTGWAVLIVASALMLSACGAGSTSSASPNPSLASATSSASGGLHVVFQSDFATEVPGVGSRSSTSCELAYASGLQISAKTQYAFCIAGFDQVPEIASVGDVSVDATVTYTDFSGSGPAGAGDVSILCRRTGSSLTTGSYYVASLSTTGYWAMDKYVDGQRTEFPRATDKTLRSLAGLSRRLTLQCLDSEGSTRLSFSVDGKEVASHTDPSGLSAGAIGLGTTNYLSPPFDPTGELNLGVFIVTYRSLSVSVR